MDIKQQPDPATSQTSVGNSTFAKISVSTVDSHGRRFFGRLVAGVVVAFILITCAVAYIAFAPNFPANALDSGWEFAVNAAVAKGLVFGKNVIFTFGPYGSVYTQQYNAATDTMMLAGGALVASAVAFILLCLSEGISRLIALMLALLLLLVPGDAKLFALPLLALMLTYEFSRHRTDAPIAATGLVKFTFVLTILALGLLPLVKGTFGISAGIVVLFACLLLTRRRRFGLAFGTIGLFLASLAVFWMLAGQPIQFLPGYFLAQIPIVSGYTDAMSTPGPVWQVIVFILIGSLLWLSGNLGFRADGDAGLALATGSALLLFLAFKEGLVRADHVFIAGSMLGITGTAFFLIRRTPLTAGGCIVGLIGLLTVNNLASGLKQFVDPVAAQFEGAAASIGLRIKHPDVLKTEYADSLTAIRAAQAVPKVLGTTDIYSYGQSQLLASGLDLDPRPVLQSYSAYTPALAAKDADFLAGRGAPANILFAVQAIDMRLPSLEDGLSWPSLLADYRFTGLYNDLALLQRQPHPAAMSMSTLLSGTFRTGELIKLPANAPFIWAELDLRQTLLGKLIGLVFKPPRPSIVYVFPDGHQQRFRYIAGMGEAGFLAAPLIQTTRDFIALSLPGSKDYFSQDIPSYIRLETGHGEGFWRSRFSLKLSAITFPIQPDTARILFTALKPAALALASDPKTQSCSIDSINGSRITRLPVDVSGFLDVTGWAAVSVSPGVAATQTAIVLTAPDGHAESAISAETPRPDVASVFGQPVLAESGFNVEVDMTGLSGNYDLTVHPSLGDETWSCSFEVPIRVARMPSGSQ